MTGPLGGVRVLDLTHGVAGPYATMLLGDLGADVVKIEKPGRGEATRYMNISKRFSEALPTVGGDYYLGINKNKRAVSIDLKHPRGRDLCLELAKWADVAVQNFRPGVMERLGLGYDTMVAVNPRLIYANLTGYGRSGDLADRPAMDVAVQARSGVMAITGPIGAEEPVKPGVSLSDFGGGAFLTMAILAALVERTRSGEGQQIDVSLYGATISMLSNYAVSVVDGAAEIAPMGSGHPQIVPYQAFPTMDGSIVIATGTNKSYRQLCAALDRPDLASDLRFDSNEKRVVHRDVLVEAITSITRTRTTAEWEKILTDAALPCAPVRTIAEAFAEPHLQEIGMLPTVRHPKLGPIHVTGIPFGFDRTPTDIRRHPPMLGEHTEEVLGTIGGCDEDDLAELRKEGVI